MRPIETNSPVQATRTYIHWLPVLVLALAAATAAGWAREDSEHRRSKVETHHTEAQSPGEGPEDRHGDPEHGEEHQEPGDRGGGEAGHGEAGHGEAEEVHLSREALENSGVRVARAGRGRLRTTSLLPGEVLLNPDRLAHITPRVPGIAREVLCSLGDEVEEGSLLAVLESRELADAKAAYLEARERLELARSSLERERELFERKVSPEKDYLQARQKHAEARIVVRSARQKLYALGIREAAVEALPKAPSRTLTRFDVRAPFDGTIIEKHLTLGEFVERGQDVFLVADLSSVWVELVVYARDLPRISSGQPVLVTGEGTGRSARGVVDYISPVIDEKTRTARARVVLPNPERKWRPGLFVTARVEVGDEDVGLAIPVQAVQLKGGKPIVFVQGEEAGEFVPRPIQRGRTDGRVVEVLSGLRPGETIAVEGSFTLLAELGKTEAGHDH